VITGPRLILALVLALALALAGVGAAAASRRDWTGSAACGACHPAQLAAWQATPHATTKRRFQAPAQAPARCLACHGTGDAPAGRAYFAEVGCEACHGPGGHYAEDDVMRDRPLARALGLADVTTPAARTAICASCHVGSTKLKPADLAAPVHPIAAAKDAP
jgi:cytochrome c551/c552